jgi:hypothetical protein
VASANIPDPPGQDVDPLVEVWPPGRFIWRCHDAKLKPTEFNPGFGRGRFHPISTTSGQPIPTLYGADSAAGMLSESVFRGVPARGSGKRIFKSALGGFALSLLSTHRHLRLADLGGHGLMRLGLRRDELTASGPSCYSKTSRWAEAIHRDRPDLDGLMWVPRHNDRTLAVMLFGDRVAPGTLSALGDTLPLVGGTGLRYVLDAAEAADVTVIV